MPIFLLLSALGLAADDPSSLQEAGKPAVLSQFTIPGVEPKADDSDSPIPEGFPRATPPGVIEVKHYPEYRSAVARGRKMTLTSGDMLFWSLFQHIERNEISMTAPVIQTFSRDITRSNGGVGEVSMEFLYRTRDMGKLGPDGRAVEVLDHPVGSYVCLGIQGGMSDRKMREAIAVLQSWLKDHSDQWTEDGPPRRLGYHGPMTPTNRRLWEIQIPVRPASEPPASAPPENGA